MNYQLRVVIAAFSFGLAVSPMAAAPAMDAHPSLSSLRDHFHDLSIKVNDVIEAMASTKKLTLNPDAAKEEFDDFMGHIKALKKLAKSDDDKRIVATSIALLKNVIGDINYKLQALEQKLQ